MNGLEEILNGLEDHLALLRELGVWSVEMDRSLLAERAPAGASAPAARPSQSAAAMRRPPAPAPRAAPAAAANAGLSPRIRCKAAFLVAAPLDEAGSEMTGKIVAALGGDAVTMPVVSDGPLPDAASYIVLGAASFKKWFPQFAAVAPGTHIVDGEKRRILVTHAPGDILRFPVVTPALAQMKRRMWASIKAVVSGAEGAI